MNAFDKFLIGDTSSINWCFENHHFIDRLHDNGISKQYVVDCLMDEEPIKYEHVDNNTYAAVYDAPPKKDYKEIRVLMAVNGNSIDLVTIMRNNETTTERQKRQYSQKNIKI